MGLAKPDPVQHRNLSPMLFMQEKAEAWLCVAGTDGGHQTAQAGENSRTRQEQVRELGCWAGVHGLIDLDPGVLEWTGPAQHLAGGAAGP